MKFITPIYDGTVGNVQVLNKLLDDRGIENKVPRHTSLKAFVYYDENEIVTIELSFDNRFNEYEVYIVQQDCDEYYFLEHRIDPE